MVIKNEWTNYILVTILGGIIVFVAGEIVNESIIKPAMKLKKELESIKELIQELKHTRDKSIPSDVLNEEYKGKKTPVEKIIERI